MNSFPNKILLATDGSEDGDLAARAAVELSNRTASELHVVHVWHDVPTPHFRSFVRAQLRQEAEEVLNKQLERDRKSTRLNSSHANISYAVFCLKKNISRIQGQ